MVRYTIGVPDQIAAVLVREVKQRNTTKNPGDPDVTAESLIEEWVMPHLRLLQSDREQRVRDVLAAAFLKATVQQQTAALDPLGFTIANGEVVEKP